MSSGVAPTRGRPRRSTSASRDNNQYYSKRHSEDDELSDSGSEGSDSGGADRSHRPRSPSDARPRRTRTLMTAQQLTILHALLQQTRFPTTAQREETARQTGLTPRKVQVWFQNQRQKQKSDQNRALSCSQNDAARRTNTTNPPPLYSANSGTQWRAAGSAAAYQTVNAPGVGAQGQYAAVPMPGQSSQYGVPTRTPMDPIRPSTPDMYMPMGVANGQPARRRYDSVTYDSRGAVAPPRSSGGVPMYGMAPVATENVPASAEDYRLRSIRNQATPSRSNSVSQPRYSEDLRLPPLKLDGDHARGRTSSTSRPPVAGTRPSHLRTSSNIPPPFTLEPQPMWSSPPPVVQIPVPGTQASAVDARNRSGSDPLRGFDELHLSPQRSSPLAPTHHRGQSLQVNQPLPSIARIQNAAGVPPRSSTPGPYPAGYPSNRHVAAGPPVADPPSRSSTPAPGKKSFWKWGSKS
ncbi:hypothetical protein DL93DRAFT_1638674 [Clavulina sp. PMI_390]|nr:hypothetical protein DL93DRAFT_1638674 [Clavulina sp. PMI_390]